MKPSFKVILCLFFSIFSFVSVKSQSPQKFSYQAVIRGNDGKVVISHAVGVRISILQNSPDGNSVYVETHRAVTNENGLLSIEIGDGYSEQGIFATINWNEGTYFIKTEIDPLGQDNYSIKGVSQLLSVPFALHSQTAESLTEDIVETDPEFQAWDKSEGISVTEDQISDLNHFTNDDETDPLFSEAAAAGITGDDISRWNNKLETESDPEFQAWNKSEGIRVTEEQITDLNHFTNEDETDPVFEHSKARSITQADIDKWNTKSDFSGNFDDLFNKPVRLSDFQNDEGFQRSRDDADVSSTNELQDIYGTGNSIGITGGNRINLMNYEGDPDFNQWDKKTGIKINESQIVDLDHFNGNDITGNESAFAGWDKNAADDFSNTNETDRIYSADSAYIKTGTRSWNSSLAKKITEADTTYWGRVETDPYYSTDSAYIKTGTRSWNSSLAKKITEADTAYWGRVETDPYYSADSAFIKNGVRNWNSSVSSGIAESDTAYWNDKTYISDKDGDTKIETERTADEDVLRMRVAGHDFFNADDSGVEFVLPTNDNTTNLKVTKRNGTPVFGVDAFGAMYGDGSGLSNVKSLVSSSGGDQKCQITANYAYYQNVKSVTLKTPSTGKCFVMASGYVRWESKVWDLYLAGILRNSDPNTSWSAEDEWYKYLNIATDYNCADSSDQYASFAQHRCFNVGAGTQTFTLWVNKYSSSAKVRMDDVNLTVLFFPTAGTGSGPMMESTQLEDDNENQEPDVPINTTIPRAPDGREIELNTRGEVELFDEEDDLDDEIAKLQETVLKLQVENEKLKTEKLETDQRITDIEGQIQELLNER